MNYLLQVGDGFGSVWIIILLGLVLITVFGSIRNRKERTARMAMMEELKPGDEIVTYAGVYAKIETISNTTDGKIVLISTGEGDKVSYMQMHINAIASISNKQPVTDDDIFQTSQLDNDTNTNQITDEPNKNKEENKDK